MAEEAFIASCSHNLTEYARSINQPVLLLCGDEDDITSIEAQREAATMYADATYVEMLGVGHLPHYERVEVVAKHTDEFITLNK
jgi:pimeloyl-ACP methyl ester carboxylesterase